MIRLFMIVFVAGASLASVGDAIAQVPSCGRATPASGTPVVAAPLRVEVGDGEGLLWGAGSTGVLLVHGAIYDAASWTDQAEAMADAGFAALALEQISPEDVLAGIAYLVETTCVEQVVVVGASAGASSAIAALSSQPTDVAGLIVLAGSGDVTRLGAYPKLFVASEGDGVSSAMTRLAEEAPGSENVSLLLPGSAHAQALFGTDQGPTLLDAMLAFIASIAEQDECAENCDV